MYMNQKIVIEWVARFIYFKFPNRPDRRLSLGDACLFTGDCPHHPVGSHRNKTVFDQNYYTWGQSNTTQYRAGIVGDIEHEIVYLWNTKACKCTGCRTCGEYCLYEHVFDWERNYWFWLLIDEIFPKSSIMAHTDLTNVIREHVTVEYGSTAASTFYKTITTTGGTTWFHHTHAHIDLSTLPTNSDGIVNLDFDFKKFQEKMRKLKELNKR